MRQIVSFVVCMFAVSPVFAQFPEVKPVQQIALVKEKGKVVSTISYLPQTQKGVKKNAIAGHFTNPKRQPVKGVRAFIYMPDSSIGASGFSDEKGYYETNSVLPGKYDLKLVYPTSKAAIRITGVPIMQGYLTEISYWKADAPAADTVIEYKDIAPKVPEKEKDKKKK